MERMIMTKTCTVLCTFKKYRVATGYVVVTNRTGHIIAEYITFEEVPRPS